MKLFQRLAISSLSIIILTALDIASKIIAETFLKPISRVEILGNFLVLIYAENHGAFLGMGAGMNPVAWFALFIVIPVIIIAFMLFQIISKADSGRLLFSGYLFVISGGAGNLIDRIFREGYVRDFINAGIGDMLRTGILNIADLYVTAGVILILIGSGMMERKTALKP